MSSGDSIGSVIPGLSVGCHAFAALAGERVSPLGTRAAKACGRREASCAGLGAAHAFAAQQFQETPRSLARPRKRGTPRTANRAPEHLTRLAHARCEDGCTMRLLQGHTNS